MYFYMLVSAFALLHVIFYKPPPEIPDNDPLEPYMKEIEQYEYLNPELYASFLAQMHLFKEDRDVQYLYQAVNTLDELSLYGTQEEDLYDIARTIGSIGESLVGTESPRYMVPMEEF
jgi:hypothetical protein